MGRPIRALDAAAAIVLAAVVMLCSCSAPEPVVDGASPKCAEAVISAGSQLDEGSQFVEVRLSFDDELSASGDVLSDLDVRLNGEQPDGKTVAVSAQVEGRDLIVRLQPSAAAAQGGSAYFALYDGQLSIGAARADGALAHARVQGGESAAVLDRVRWFTVPSGVVLQETGASDGRDGRVEFEVMRFAQLRCCTWIRFSEELPSVRLHNHQFYRDTERICAQRLVDTLNETYGQWFVAECDGARVSVRSVDPSIELDVQVIEGEDALPGDDGGVGAWEEGA